MLFLWIGTWLLSVVAPVYHGLIHDIPRGPSRSIGSETVAQIFGWVFQGQCTVQTQRGKVGCVGVVESYGILCNRFSGTAIVPIQWHF
jgi:hypothetical protein